MHSGRTAERKRKNPITNSTWDKSQMTYRGTVVRLCEDFSLATVSARRQWNKLVIMRGRNDLWPRSLYLTESLFTNEGETSTFFRKQRLGRVSHPRALAEGMASVRRKFWPERRQSTYYVTVRKAISTHIGGSKEALTVKEKKKGNLFKIKEELK